MVKVQLKVQKIQAASFHLLFNCPAEAPHDNALRDEAIVCPPDAECREFCLAPCSHSTGFIAITFILQHLAERGVFIVLHFSSRRIASAVVRASLCGPCTAEIAIEAPQSPAVYIALFFRDHWSHCLDSLLCTA